MMAAVSDAAANKTTWRQLTSQREEDKLRRDDFLPVNFGCFVRDQEKTHLALELHQSPIEVLDLQHARDDQHEHQHPGDPVLERVEEHRRQQTRQRLGREHSVPAKQRTDANVDTDEAAFPAGRAGQEDQD